MRDLSALTAADFEAAVGSVFAVTCGAEDLEVRLVEVVRFTESPDHRQPFSARFVGPLTPALEQDVHHLVSDAMGELELFVVPTGAHGEGLTYEAVFG